MAQAGELDAKQRARKLRGPLHGIPLALKDNVDTAGIRTTAASAIFDDRIPEQDAEVARRLKAAGTVLIGKANLHEFAMGGTSATSYYGPVRNPWALDRNPGDSSGGSAAGVSAELCYGALVYRYRRIDPNTCSLLRSSRAEADIWSGSHSGNHSIDIFARPLRSDRKDG